MRRCVVRSGTIIFLVMLLASLTACNLSTARSNSSPLAGAGPTATDFPNDGTHPTVTIEAPGSNAQAVINRPLTVRVHARDTLGVTNVVMSESDRVVSQESSPDPSTDFVALLTYVPQSGGMVTLKVIAYRGGVASPSAAIAVQVVGTTAELANPNALDPTTGVAAGVVCTVRVNVSTLNLRTGPGTTYSPVGHLSVGDIFNVIGRNADSSWYQIRNAANVSGWAAAAYLQTNGNCSKAPVISP